MAGMKKTTLSLLAVLACSLPQAGAVMLSQQFAAQYRSGEFPNFKYQTVASIDLIYLDGFTSVNPANGSIHTMTMNTRIGSVDFARNGVMLANKFEFSFFPGSGIADFGSIYSLPATIGLVFSGGRWDIFTGNIFNSDNSSGTFVDPVERIVTIEQARFEARVPDSGSSAALLFGSLAGLGWLAKRKGHEHVTS